MAIAFHVVARTTPFITPLTDRGACADLWQRLRRAFPEVAAVVLMPNHLHIICLTCKPRDVKWKLGVALRGWTQRFYPGKRVWTPIPNLEAIPDLHHLKRQIRYVHLNPCRARLATDPLAWEWSTHRDISGCVVDPWPNSRTLTEAFEARLSSLGEKMHRYVSSDPSVNVSGTPPLREVRAGEPISADLKWILRASAVVLREDLVIKKGKLRDLAIQVAHGLGVKIQSDALGLEPRSWRRAVALPRD